MSIVGNSNFITVGEQTYEVVTKIPVDYEVLTGMQGMPEGYLPICHKVVRNSAKVIQTPAAQKILAVAESGFKTLSAMEDYVAQNQGNPSPWTAYRLQKIQEVIPVMLQFSIVGRQTYENAAPKDNQDKQKKPSYNGGSKKLTPYRQALSLVKNLKTNASALNASGLKKGQYESTLSTIHNVIVEHMQKVSPYPLSVKFIKYIRGEAVYIQELSDGVFTKDCKMARWVICDQVDKENGQITFSHVGTFSLDDYGKTWQVYKYKP